jgi:hypothetical protein
MAHARRVNNQHPLISCDVGHTFRVTGQGCLSHILRRAQGKAK